ncbi:MAG: hypothetical protein ABI468_04120 [Candidatus Nanopelagicales bacterium]
MSAATEPRSARDIPVQGLRAGGCTVRPAPARSTGALSPARRRPAVLVMVFSMIAALAVVGGAPPLTRIGAVVNAHGTSVSATPTLSQVQLRATASILLATRAQAVLARDPAAFAQTSAAGGSGPDYRRLANLPITAWAYHLGAVSSDGSVATVTATLAYRFSGDSQSALLPLEISLLDAGGRWVVSSERTSGSRPAIWEVGIPTVVRGQHSLVIGVGDTSSAVAGLRQWARTADQAVLGVRRVLPEGWVPRVTVVVPASTADLATLLGRDSAGLTQIGAVTTAEARGEDRPARGADRVWLNTPLLAKLTPLGRLILLRHEVTHVATGSAATDATPLWLEEGLAEVVGYRGSGVSLATAATDATALVRAGQVLGGLPTMAALTGPMPAAAYEEAYLACVVLTDEVGLPGLVRLYRLTARGAQSDPAGNVDRALRRVTGSGTAALTRAWRALLTAVAERPTPST